MCRNHGSDGCALFGQGLISMNGQLSLSMGSFGSGLSSADSDCVVSGSHEPVAMFIHKAEVAGLKRQANVLLLAAVQMNALEAAKRSEGSTGYFRKNQVKFDDLVSG